MPTRSLDQEPRHAVHARPGTSLASVLRPARPRSRRRPGPRQRAPRGGPSHLTPDRAMPARAFVPAPRHQDHLRFAADADPAAYRRPQLLDDPVFRSGTQLIRRPDIGLWSLAEGTSRIDRHAPIGAWTCQVSASPVNAVSSRKSCRGLRAAPDLCSPRSHAMNQHDHRHYGRSGTDPITARTSSRARNHCLSPTCSTPVRSIERASAALQRAGPWTLRHPSSSCSLATPDPEERPAWLATDESIATAARASEGAGGSKRAKGG
jgi:hypothetical protein